MNVQVPPTRAELDFEQEERHGSPWRKYLAGGIALVLIVGGYWYYTPTRAPGMPAAAAFRRRRRSKSLWRSSATWR